jgi:hypothetical protein
VLFSSAFADNTTSNSSAVSGDDDDHDDVDDLNAMKGEWDGLGKQYKYRVVVGDTAEKSQKSPVATDGVGTSASSVLAGGVAPAGAPSGA